MHFSKIENDMAQVILNATHTSCRLMLLQKTLCELDKEIKKVHDLISHSESEIAKGTIQMENKQVLLSQYKRRLEEILSQQGVCTWTFHPRLGFSLRAAHRCPR